MVIAGKKSKGVKKIMDKTEFFYKYINASDKMNLEERIRIEKESIDPNPINVGPGNRNLIIVMEECSELIQELINVQLDMCDMMSLIEETADVLAGLDYVKFICQINDIDIKTIRTKIISDKEKNTTRLDVNNNSIFSLANLQQQISKYLRGKNNKETLTQAVAYVYNTIDNIKYAHRISEKDLNKAINVKLQRLIEFKQNNTSTVYQ